MVPETLNAPAPCTHLGDPWVFADLLSRPGVLENGHFRLLSGAHSEHFLRFSKIADRAEALDAVASALMPSVAVWQPDAVLAPSTAGVSLGRELAARLGVPLHLAGVDAAGRASGTLGAESLADRSVLLVNDIVTTGQGLAALAAVARDSGADVAGAAWFASRNEVDVTTIIDAPAAFVLSIDLPSTGPEQCALCSSAEPVEDALDLN